MRPKTQIPAEIEEYRDERWRREGTRQVETALDAERFIDQVGFAACLTDSRRPGPSLYVAVCGRRDAVMPRNVQKDPEASLTWVLKDEIVTRGKVYYAKLARRRTMFLAPRMIPYFHAVWGVRRSEEKRRLSRNAQAIVHVLRKEWEMSTSDLRDESGVKDRTAFTRGVDELQAAMIVVPSEVFYQPKFTYIWTLGVGRFPEALRRRVSRDTALREIARGFLAGAGMTIPGEMARVTGLPRPEAGRGNRALVFEGYATMPAPGTYRLAASRALDEAGFSTNGEVAPAVVEENSIEERSVPSLREHEVQISVAVKIPHADVRRIRRRGFEGDDGVESARCLGPLATQCEDPQDRDEQSDDLRHRTAPSAPARQPTPSSSLVPEHDNGIDGAGAARRDEGGGGRHSEHDDARDADQSRIPRGRVWQQFLREPPDGE
jgi:hypothetical protein